MDRINRIRNVIDWCQAKERLGLVIDFSDLQKQLGKLIEEQKKQNEVEEKDWKKIKRIIYLSAKTYTSKDNARRISDDALHYLIANGVSLDTPISVKHNIGGIK